MQGCTSKIPSVSVRVTERSKSERKICHHRSEFFKLTGSAYFFVCLCFKYPDGIDQFDNLKKKFKNSAVRQISCP